MQLLVSVTVHFKLGVSAFLSVIAFLSVSAFLSAFFVSALGGETGY
jgi:hypothetical protein